MHSLIKASTLAVAVLTGSLFGQRAEPSNPAHPVTLKQAVEFAAENHPSLRASVAEVSAATGEIDLARTAYLPRTEILVAVNRATRNNIFGLIFPNSVIPSISGPVQPETAYESTFGSAAGALFSWEPLDFGLRRADVQAAEARKARAQAVRGVAEYEISLAVTQAYLNAVASQQTVKAAQATVERMRIFADVVSVLVKNELRPGVDESRARAEVARASIEQIRAEQQAQAALATLAEWMGLGGETVQIQPAALLGEPPRPAEAAASLEEHPRTQAQEAEVAVVQAAQRALKKEWRPRFEVQSAFYGRGTGARLDGTFKGGAHGLAPSEGNWAVGFNMRFDLFNYKENRVRRQVEEHHEESERAQKQQVVQELKGQLARATIAVDAAHKVVENTPIELAAARTLESQAQARYRAGLGTVVEVAEAQRLLRLAEVEDTLARLGVWRALFARAAAQGEMEGLLNASSQ